MTTNEYDFRTLSPIAFEHLVQDLLNADLGLALRSYAAGRDRGIDLWETGADGAMTVVQCKHYANSSWSTLLRAVRKEAGREYLHTERYLFVTSRVLSPHQQDQIVAELAGLSVAHVAVWGRDHLNARSLVILGCHARGTAGAMTGRWCPATPGKSSLGGLTRCLRIRAFRRTESSIRRRLCGSQEGLLPWPGVRSVRGGLAGICRQRRTHRLSCV